MIAVKTSNYNWNQFNESMSQNVDAVSVFPFYETEIIKS